MSGAGFLIDLGRCVGCGACVLACRIENEWPDGVSWRRVLPLNLDRLPGGPTYHLSVACHHCEHPVCLTACPSGAYEQRDDGVVILVQDRCLGCRYCEMACPFCALSFDTAARIMTKCDFCSRRTDQGLSPACIETCPTGALQLLPDRDGDTVQLDEGETVKHVVEAAAIPGFADPARCKPRIQFVEPRGLERIERLEQLREVLEQ